MELNEKLQQLRKSKGLTQEELAECLFVSRTAISKWESGRGYPNIESLKEISKFFSITIDDLLSSEKALYIAEKENKMNIKNVCDLLFGITDLLNILLIILPLYPKQTNEFVYSVSLFAYAESEPVYSRIYWAVFALLILIGILKVVFNQMEIKKGRHIITNISVAINIVTVLLLSLTRQAYALIISFLLLVVKCITIIKRLNNS